MSPEATASANNGQAPGGVTAGQLGSGLLNSMGSNNTTSNPLISGYSPTSQQLGMSSPAATDTMGSKLVESLQGARKTSLDETSNRLAAQGISGGQATSQLAQADRDYAYGMSQGLGDFNIKRLNQAASINKDFLALELQRELGLGNLELGSQELDSTIALKLSELAQNADTQTRREISDLMEKYFGTGA